MSFSKTYLSIQEFWLLKGVMKTLLKLLKDSLVTEQREKNRLAKARAISSGQKKLAKREKSRSGPCCSVTAAEGSVQVVIWNSLGWHGGVGGGGEQNQRSEILALHEKRGNPEVEVGP